MKSMLKSVAIAALACLSLPAFAGVSLNGVRVGAKDVAALAKFYQGAFGMQEVQRIENPQMLEIMLNFGATREAAQATRAAKDGSDIVLMSRASDDAKDDMPHIVLNVTDMGATVKALKAAGGRMEREPFEFGKSGIWIGMAIDPAGNHIELIQMPKAAPAPARK
ncbi:MAG: Glyoxalase-like domain [Pseudomonadota bacterium]|jgi:predicted enzyme related to lactoylglutathione lyase